MGELLHHVEFVQESLQRAILVEHKESARPCMETPSATKHSQPEHETGLERSWGEVTSNMVETPSTKSLNFSRPRLIRLVDV